ncbi:MAG: branched-chain amino acid transaminase [Clostridium sp.]|jgi:branched-chain amino acid aminotransferase|uniref:branched-chain amino acid transaminase n=1 Tax=Clostridium sp. TaxID=1506 RepID=UPI0025C65A88|nr:branched-chain amino acid transaminase [Clostridium sp.]MCH3965020.1 branched-chain amino acid transaminase [Clostridium sp.]MCI1714241.1 branched-chain amino acid transaminase [Clostridium sp.]MCI1798503.1 branched-chain amino acid transaminase [Clostridium sp.]MCI1812766.1 branched-chain amino acid transaminase [Clostridium sp.]MCI1869312.1 branched-chain amino acid transaminase [Clostridium sp.]
MSKSYVFYQGEIVDESEVTVGIRSKAFNYGLGCFEGIRAYWDEDQKQLFGFRLKDHYTRMLQSAKTLNLNIPYTVDDLVKFTVELLKKNEFKRTTYIRPIIYNDAHDIGPSLTDPDVKVVIYCQPLDKYAGKSELSVGITSWGRIEDNMIPPRVKATASYLNSALASLEAHRAGFDEAIFLTRSGHVCEGPGENLFIYKKGKLITPSASDNILEGITRDLVIRLAKEDLGLEVVERSVTRTELYASDEIFFSGTAMEVTPIVEVDHRIVGDGKEGEICRKLKELFFTLTVGKNPKYAEYCTPVY